MENEVWKEIIGFEGLYDISSLGRVKRRSYKKNIGNNALQPIKEKILTNVIGTDGYYALILHNNYKHKRFKIHRLIAIHFISNPELKPCVNHIDGNKLNNSISNLEWCTYSENNLHKYRVLGIKDKKPFGGDHWNSKKVIQLTKDGIEIKIHNAISDACRELGLYNANILGCIKGRYKTSGGFIWKYF